MKFQKPKGSDLMKTKRKFFNNCVYQYFKRTKFKILNALDRMWDILRPSSLPWFLSDWKTNPTQWPGRAVLLFIEMKPNWTLWQWWNKRMKNREGKKEEKKFLNVRNKKKTFAMQAACGYLHHQPPHHVLNFCSSVLPRIFYIPDTLYVHEWIA